MIFHQISYQRSDFEQLKTQLQKLTHQFKNAATANRF